MFHLASLSGFKNPIPLLSRFVLTPILLLCTASASNLAAEPGPPGAHVHGFGSLNMALDGNILYVELGSPAANILGFEHAPVSEREKVAVRQTLETIEDGGKLFVPDRKAGCVLQESVVHHSLQPESTESSDHDSTHGHAAAPGNGDHGKDEHGGESHDEHSEIEAAYTFLCSRPDMLKGLDLRLFEHFPGFERIELQLLTPNGQKGATLTPKNHRISF